MRRVIMGAGLAVALSLAFGCAGSVATGPMSDREISAGVLNPKTDRPGLRVGERAPRSSLVDADGAEVSLGDLYADGPVVLTFYRGGWCPFCNKDLKEWQDRIGEIRGLGATFVAVSVEAPEHAAETIEKDGLEYVVLSDREGRAIRDFKLAFNLTEKTEKMYRRYGIDLDTWNSSGRWELPAPATFIIDKKGVVRWAYADWNYQKRADQDEVIEALAGLVHGG